MASQLLERNLRDPILCVREDSDEDLFSAVDCLAAESEPVPKIGGPPSNPEGAMLEK